MRIGTNFQFCLNHYIRSNSILRDKLIIVSTRYNLTQKELLLLLLVMSTICTVAMLSPYTIWTIPKTNQNIVDWGKFDTLTHIHHHLLSLWLDITSHFKAYSLSCCYCDSCCVISIFYFFIYKFLKMWE